MIGTAAVLPPSCKTGVELTQRGTETHGKPSSSSSLGIHWLRGTVSVEKKDELRGFLELCFGKSWSREKGFFGYTHCYRWTCGVSLNYFADERQTFKQTAGLICLDVSGSACEQFTPADMEFFIGCLDQLGFKPTRLDLYFDDYERLIEPYQLQGIIRKGDFGGFRVAGNVQKWKDGFMIHDEATFGRRGKEGSGKYLRVYDKALESNFQTFAIRWELELTDSRAKQVWKGLMVDGDLEALARHIGAVIGGSVCFFHRKKDPNTKRYRLYRFWEAILKRIGRFRLLLNFTLPSIEKSRQWVEKSVAPTLTAIKKAVGDDERFFEWFLNLCDKDHKLRQRHKAAIAEYRSMVRRLPTIDVLRQDFCTLTEQPLIVFDEDGPDETTDPV